MSIELNNIYCMDCLDGLKQIPDNSVDSVITDPPYNINLQPQRKKTKAILNDNLNKYEFKAFLWAVFAEIDRVLKDNSFLVIFTGWSTIPEFREVLDVFFTLKSQPVWIKNNFGIGYYTRPQYEPAFLYLKGKPEILKNPVSDVWKFNKIQAPVHSCEKPLDLMRFIVENFSKEGNVILDPFIGVGNSMLAAKQLNRKFIGFEISPEYAKITKERLKQDTFAKGFGNYEIKSSPALTWKKGGNVKGKDGVYR